MPVTAVRTMLAYRSNVAQIDSSLSRPPPSDGSSPPTGVVVASSCCSFNRLSSSVIASSSVLSSTGGECRPPDSGGRPGRPHAARTAADIVQEVRVAGPDGHDKPRRAQQMHLEQPAGRGDQPRDRAQPLADLHPAGLAESLEPARRRIVETAMPAATAREPRRRRHRRRARRNGRCRFARRCRLDRPPPGWWWRRRGSQDRSS